MNDDERTIFKIEHNSDNPYVILDKRPIENPSMSWKAKGLLAYLISRPDKWIVRMGDLIKRSTDGEHATRAAIQELIDAGHIVRETVRQGGRFESWTMKVYEQPFCGFPQVEKPQVENLAHSNIESSNNETSNIGEGAENAPTPPEKTEDSQLAIIRLVKKITGKRSIPVELWETLSDTLTTKADEVRLRECWVSWRARGFSRDNYAWALEWYKNGIPNGRPGSKPARDLPAITSTDGGFYA
jgi:hypothetical protein